MSVPMTVPYYVDDYLTLHQGDATDVLSTLDASSVQTCVTSPPYFGLRDYGTGPAQLGLESSPSEYVARLVAVFRGVRRVLRDDGTVWLNLGDSYARGNGQGNAGPSSTLQGGVRPSFRADGATVAPAKRSSGIPDKNLLGIPWRVAFALQDDGWILRNAIVWDKPNAMPESVTDRLASTYELVFLLSKSRRYWFDLDAIREPHAASTISAAPRRRIPYCAPGQPPNTKTRGMHDGGANPGDVWPINTCPYPGAHFATMPPALARRCILAGCPEGGTVLDPFIGSGTTALVANSLGRRAVGIDLSAPYLDQALRRCKDAPLPFDVLTMGDPT